MAVTIQTKRSTGTDAPGTLSAGELAVRKKMEKNKINFFIIILFKTPFKKYK